MQGGRRRAHAFMRSAAVTGPTFFPDLSRCWRRGFWRRPSVVFLLPELRDTLPRVVSSAYVGGLRGVAMRRMHVVEIMSLKEPHSLQID